MASAAQILANQANAQLSTGPRSQEGKARSSKNALAHGICSREFVILPGEESEFDSLVAKLNADLRPVTSFEEELFRQIVHASWTLRRCRLAESALLESALHPDVDPLLDGSNETRLKRIDLYSRRDERSFYRAIKKLRAVQTAPVPRRGPSAPRIPRQRRSHAR